MNQSIRYRKIKLAIKGQPTVVSPLKLKFLKNRMIRYASLRQQGLIPEYKYFIPNELTKY